jgi:HD-GYP domain-containing protein (c-di-GMP phosphodiesterase class II)
MQYSPLSIVKDRITVGQPLPFNVRDADRTLLLARGQVIETHDQLVALFRRGALVDLAELQRPEDLIRRASPGELPQLWTQCLGQLGDALRQSGQARFVDALDDAVPSVMALVERDRDLAIFQVLRQSGNALVEYGVNHSLHAAITAFLVAQRLAWSSAESQRAFKAALTMNISMLELQGQLALQTSPPTPEQREAIAAHPEFSVRMLELSGVSDADWLAGVAQHHESPDGGGYPQGLTDVHMIAALVRRADIYTAKLSPRATRDAMAADAAGRAMFMHDPGHPMTAALVKEFGVYPPGAFVRLASGEIGIVVRRGPTVTTPVVAVLTSAAGHHISEPLRRDSQDPDYAILGIVGDKGQTARLAPGTLMALMA